MINTLLFITGAFIGVGIMISTLVYLIAKEAKRQTLLQESDFPIGQQLADEMGIEL